MTTKGPRVNRRAKKRELLTELAKYVEDEKRAGELDEQFAKMPPELRPMRGAIAGLISLFGPEKYRGGALLVMLQSVFSEGDARARRRALRLARKK